MLATLNPCLRQRSDTEIQASCFLTIPVICSSVKRLRRHGLSKGHPCRPRFGVRQPRPRPVSLRQRRHPRLLATRQADRQRLHRNVQLPPPSRMPERPLVSDACGRRGKVGDLAQLLRRGSAARGHRQQAAVLAVKSRWRSQPATVTKARKLHPRAVQRSVSDQRNPGLSLRPEEKKVAGQIRIVSSPIATHIQASPDPCIGAITFSTFFLLEVPHLFICFVTCTKLRQFCPDH